jgi:hypothetical protein
MDGLGRLTISANALSITGTLGGDNLLNNTSPLEEEIGVLELMHWQNDENKKCFRNGIVDNKKGIELYYSSLSQINLDLKENTQYSLSGQIYYVPGSFEEPAVTSGTLNSLSNESAYFDNSNRLINSNLPISISTEYSLYEKINGYVEEGTKEEDIDYYINVGIEANKTY